MKIENYYRLVFFFCLISISDYANSMQFIRGLQFWREEQRVRNLCHAAERSDIEGIRSAIAAGENVNSHADFLGMTPLMCAARYGAVDAITELVRLGANVNEKDIPDRWGKRALDYAVRVPFTSGTNWDKQMAVIKELVRLGANLNAEGTFTSSFIEDHAEDTFKVPLKVIRFLFELGARPKDPEKWKAMVEYNPRLKGLLEHYEDRDKSKDDSKENMSLVDEDSKENINNDMLEKDMMEKLNYINQINVSSAFIRPNVPLLDYWKG